MKKLTVLVFALVIGVGQVFASNNTPSIATEEEIRNEVADLLKDPEIKIEKNNLTADIQFTVNKNGEIVVLTVDSEKDLVVDYIKSRLNYKKVIVEKTTNVNRLYNLTLIIKNPQDL